jgi:hypothetical protein
MPRITKIELFQENDALQYKLSKHATEILRLTGEVKDLSDALENLIISTKRTLVAMSDTIGRL